MNKKLWEQYADWKENYRFVDLTHELSPETLGWFSCYGCTASV